MKRIVQIGTYKSGNSRLEVVDLADLEVTLNENTAVFVGHTTVTSQIRGQAATHSYQISRAYLKRHSRWRLVASQRDRVAAKAKMMAGHHVRRAAA
jgi:hypothetical protein